MSKIPRKQELRDKFYMKKTFHLSQWIKTLGTLWLFGGWMAVRQRP
jgi:hypothetical protein